MIKSIVFDVGGVISGDVVDDFLPYITKKYKDKSWGFLRAKFRYFANFYKLGKITEDEFWKQLLDSYGIKEDIDYLKSLAKKCVCKGVDGTMDVARKLKNDYRLAILSNHGEEWFMHIMKKFKLDKIFDPIIVSTWVHCAKPEPKIFEILLEKLKLKPNECVYIDNKSKNIATATNLGFNCIMFNDAEQLKHDLNKLGVKI